MKSTTETYKVDRSEWPSGPWDIEPDLFTFEHLGMPCTIIRNNIGIWCGYVAVASDHPLYGKHYDIADNLVEVHGSLTYGGDHSPHHDPQLNEWWFGFDCAHSGDLMPGMLKYASVKYLSTKTFKFMSECHYITMDEVIEETKNLANQLSNLKNEDNNPNS